MYLLAKLQQQCQKKSLSTSGEQTIAFVFLQSIIIAITVLFGKTICLSYLFYLSSVYGMKWLGEIYKQ